MVTRNPAPHVYRVSDPDGLIYIGSTIRLQSRLKEHRSYSWWTSTAVKVTSRLCLTVEDARRREREAIVAEVPRWNIYNQINCIPSWSEEEVDDYFERWVLDWISNVQWAAGRIGRRVRDDYLGAGSRERARIPLVRYKNSRGHPFDVERVPALAELFHIDALVEAKHGSPGSWFTGARTGLIWPGDRRAMEVAC